MTTPEELATRFTYHPPKDGQPPRYEQIRAAGHDLAELLTSYCPESSELVHALDHVDQAVMWANAAIARREA